MDFLKNLGGAQENSQSSGNTVATEAGGRNTTTDMAGKGGEGGGGIMGKFNNMLGGGAAGEKKEDGLDKGVDWVQQHIMGEGPQNNESAAEEAKDEMISDMIRGEYKSASVTGMNFPIQDK
ncbi:hypothetical protein BD410DRAFT_789013 [Rickenella mellea]|uniref:DNA damage-responsive protein 48 n=1 Tax=Rickenella mellea TaxID=50990 RepID=A0A4Y7Q2Q4_9AGAM|nr:hypothetical protein BD410DRAFT_789013 [Rickenella mellea]